MPEPKGDTASRALTPDEQKRRAKRNLAIAAAIVTFIVLIYAITIVRLGANVG